MEGYHWGVDWQLSKIGPRVGRGFEVRPQKLKQNEKLVHNF